MAKNRAKNKANNKIKSEVYKKQKIESIIKSRINLKKGKK